MDSRAESRYLAAEDIVPPPEPGPDAHSIADRRIAACLDQQAPELDLNGLGLQELPAALRSFTWLRTLRCHNNRLQVLPDWIDALSGLRELDLRGNPLEAIPPSFRRLTRLRLLLIDGSSGSSSCRRIATDFGDTLQHIASLESLGLTRLGLPEVPSWIQHLRNLQRLWLFSNTLTSLPDWIGQLSQLRVLSVRNNHLEALPESLRTIKSLDELHIEENPGLRLPEEIAGARSAPRILDYYYRTAAPGAGKPLNEFKLILVGRGGVGKTTLVERMVNGRFMPTKRTPGINITNWTLKIDGADVRAHIWDFGGQEIMHGTHRFFMTERALYLVLLTGREDSEDRDAEHWLSLVRSFAGDAPIIVVLHKWDEERFELNRALLRDKYGQGIAFEDVDSYTGHGIAGLQHRICELASNLPGLRSAWPAQWWRIKEQLPALKSSWLTYQAFCDFAHEHGVAEPKDQEALAYSLHDLGLMLSYRKDDTLRNFGVLNPQWVTKGIYGMLNSPTLRDARGVFTVNSFRDVLDHQAYPDALHPYLVALMRKFFLCFPLDDRGEKYLMPELLTKEEPYLEAEFPADKCLGFIYRYESVLPEGILQQFIVQAYVHREPKYTWRTGAVLERNHCRALVRGDVQGRQITIRVVGPTSGGRRELLGVIREYFERQHKTYQKLPVTELVPIPGHPDAHVKHETLLKYELRRREKIAVEIDDDVVDMPVKDLLDGVDLPGVRSGAHRGAVEETSGRRLSLVISHASADEVFADQLHGAIVPYERGGQLTVWGAKLITAGQEWERELSAKLDQADIVVLLLSSDFLNSYHCMDRELAQAAERHARGECEIVPIVARSCRYDMMKFLEKFQVIAPGGKPINTHTDRDGAWMMVTKEIDRVIARLKK